MHQDKINHFIQRFIHKGETGHEVFLMHAAFPLLFNADMLYRMWVNFREYNQEDGTVAMIDSVVVSDLLLSELCKPAGADVFEMEEELRKSLLAKLEMRFGQERLAKLATFTLQYADTWFTHPKDAHIRNTLRWNALSVLDPKAAARDIAHSLETAMAQNKSADQLRLVMLLDSFKDKPAFENLSGLGEAVKDKIFRRHSGKQVVLAYAEDDDDNVLLNVPEAVLSFMQLSNIKPGAGRVVLLAPADAHDFERQIQGYLQAKGGVPFRIEHFRFGMELETFSHTLASCERGDSLCVYFPPSPQFNLQALHSRLQEPRRDVSIFLFIDNEVGDISTGYDNIYIWCKKTTGQAQSQSNIGGSFVNRPFSTNSFLINFGEDFSKPFLNKEVGERAGEGMASFSRLDANHYQQFLIEPLGLENILQSRVASCKANGGRRLDLGRLELGHYNMEIFSSLENVEHLSLANNKLTAIPEEIYGMFPKLSSLNLSGNKFIEVPSIFKSHPTIRKVDLTDNDITWVGHEFLEMTTLEELHLKGNPLTNIPTDLVEKGLAAMRGITGKSIGVKRYCLLWLDELWESNLDESFTHHQFEEAWRMRYGDDIEIVDSRYPTDSLEEGEVAKRMESLLKVMRPDDYLLFVKVGEKPHPDFEEADLKKLLLPKLREGINVLVVGFPLKTSMPNVVGTSKAVDGSNLFVKLTQLLSSDEKELTYFQLSKDFELEYDLDNMHRKVFVDPLKKPDVEYLKLMGKASSLLSSANLNDVMSSEMMRGLPDSWKRYLEVFKRINRSKAIEVALGELRSEMADAISIEDDLDVLEDIVDWLEKKQVVDEGHLKGPIRHLLIYGYKSQRQTKGKGLTFEQAPQIDESPLPSFDDRIVKRMEMPDKDEFHDIIHDYKPHVIQLIQYTIRGVQFSDWLDDLPSEVGMLVFLDKFEKDRHSQLQGSRFNVAYSQTYIDKSACEDFAQLLIESLQPLETYQSAFQEAMRSFLRLYPSLGTNPIILMDKKDGSSNFA